MPEAVMQTRGLVKQFPVEGSKDVVHAVSGVDLQVLRGETLGLVGESGCGKTTMGRLVLRLVEPTSGQVLIEGRDLAALSKRDLRRVRSELQIIFQNPFASLNPRMSVEEILRRPMEIHLKISAAERAERVGRLLEQVGLREEHRNRLPARVLGRPTAADRDRAGAGGRTEVPGARRADLRARRVRPGADPQPAQAPAEASSGSPTCSSPTTCRPCAT